MVRSVPGRDASIQALYESLKNSEVAFLLVSGEERGRVRQLLEKKRWKMPAYVVEGVPRVLHTRGIPASFVANRKGEVVYRLEGTKDWNTDRFRAFLKGVD